MSSESEARMLSRDEELRKAREEEVFRTWSTIFEDFSRVSKRTGIPHHELDFSDNLKRINKPQFYLKLIALETRDSIQPEVIVAYLFDSPKQEREKGQLVEIAQSRAVWEKDTPRTLTLNLDTYRKDFPLLLNPDEITIAARGVMSATSQDLLGHVYPITPQTDKIS